MPHMPRVAAVEVSHPVPLFVFMESDNDSLHSHLIGEE